MPHAERFEPKEEGWLPGNKPIQPPSVPFIVADDRQGGSSLANGASDGAKCYYCIDSNIHAPHLHKVQLCTCAFRNAKGIGSSPTESTTVLSATSSGPRFDPRELLTPSAISLNHLLQVDGPRLLVGGEDSSRARRNGMDLPPSSRSSMAGIGAALHPRPSMPSPHVSGPPQEAVSSIRSMSRYDDPKGKRPMTDLADDEGSREISSAAPSPSDLSTAEYDSSTESDDADDEETVAGDADDDDQSSHTTAPSASLGTLEGRRKRRRRDSTDDDPRPRFAASSRLFQRRRLERTLQRAGSAPLALSRRASCSCILTGDLPSGTTANASANGFMPVAEPPPSPRESAMETLEQSHQRVRAYLSSCFASNQRLRTELAEAREDIQALEERLAEAERVAFEYYERWIDA